MSGDRSQTKLDNNSQKSKIEFINFINDNSRWLQICVVTYSLAVGIFVGLTYFEIFPRPVEVEIIDILVKSVISIFVGAEGALLGAAAFASRAFKD